METWDQRVIPIDETEEPPGRPSFPDGPTAILLGLWLARRRAFWATIRPLIGRHQVACGVQLFLPHPNLSDEINHNIAQSEIEGGVSLHDLPPESALEIETENRFYTVVTRGRGEALIWGHPEFCPMPVLVRIAGSNWGGSMLKTAFIGRGMHLEIRHPGYEKPIITSRIREVRELPCARDLLTAAIASGLEDARRATVMRLPAAHC